MNLDHLNKWLTLLANFGVIAGIIFLAIEVGQNNRLLQAQSTRSMLADRQSIAFMAYQDPAVAELMFKAANNLPLTELEDFQVRTMSQAQLLALQWQYEQFVAGNIDSMPVDGLRRTFANTPRIAEVFESAKLTFNPDFIEFVETNILNP